MYLRTVSMPSSTVLGNSVTNTSLSKLTSQENATSFGDTLKMAQSQLEELDRQYLGSQIDLVLGNARDMHTAVLNAEKASLALDLVIAMRNKAIEAYQEIMRMPV